MMHMTAQAEAEATFRQCMFDQSPYWPDYILVNRGHAKGQEFVVSTKLRKKHKDQWYAVHIMEFLATDIHLQDCRPTAGQGLTLTKRLAAAVYKWTLFGVVDTKLSDHNGKPVFQLDRIQISEEERLNPLKNERTVHIPRRDWYPAG